MADTDKKHTKPDGSGDQQQAVKKSATNQTAAKQETVKGEGVKCAIHGVFYQLKLIIVVMLHAKQLLDADSSTRFEIMSEDPLAGKFDDVVFRFWRSSSPDGVVKIQAKHKVEHADKLMWTDLKANIKAPFAIVKYFRSFLEQEDLSAIDKDQFVLCTNAKMDGQLLVMLEQVQRLSNTVDPIFDTINATHYRFNLDKLAQHTEFQKLLQQMEECSDIVCLAKVVAHHVFKKQEVTVNDPLLTKYRGAIISILDIEQDVESQTKRKDFSKEFLEGSSSTSVTGMIEFREAFRKQYQKLLPNVSDQVLWDDVQKKGIEITKRFMKQHDESHTDAFPSNIAIDLKIKQFFSQFVLSCNTLHEQLMDKPIQELWHKTMQREDALLLEQIGNIEKELAYKELFGEIFKWLGNTEVRPLEKSDVEKILCTIRNTIQLLHLKGMSNNYCQTLKKQEIQIGSMYVKRMRVHGEIRSICSENSGKHELSFVYNSPYRKELAGSIILTALELWHQDHPFDYLMFDEATFLNFHKCLLDVFTSLNSPLVFAVVCLNSTDDVLKLYKQFVNVNQSSCRRKIIICKVMQPSIAQEIPGSSYPTVETISSDTKKLMEKKYHTLNIFDTLIFTNKLIKGEDSLLMLITALEQQIKQKKQGSEIAYWKLKSSYMQRHWEAYVQKQERSVGLFNKKVEFQQLFNSFKEEMNIMDVYQAFDAFIKKEREHAFFSSTTQEALLNYFKTDRKMPCDDDQAGFIEKPNEPKRKRKVFIMLNEAGLGKSSYITCIAARLKEKVPSDWIIRLNCIEYCTDFERLLVDGKEVTIDPLNALRVLFVLIHLALFVPSINKQMISNTDLERRKAEQSAECITYSEGKVVLDEKQIVQLRLSYEQRLLLRVFQYKFNNPKLVLLVDGFDEIAPHYKNLVLELLKEFGKFTGVAKMYIASRPYSFKRSFETCFQQALFFQLPVLCFAEKVLVLHWLITKKPLTEDVFNLFDYFILIVATMVITLSLQELSDVPLFLVLGLEELMPLINKNLILDTGELKKTLFEDINMTFDKLRLMKRFVERKIRIAIFEKTSVNDAPLKTPAMKNMIDEMIAIVESRHYLLAVWAMFSKNNCKRILKTDEIEAIQRFIKEILEGNDKTGIVQSVQDNTPIFVHRMFTEYFAAQWIVEDRKRNSKRGMFSIYNEYWQQEQLNMRRFIDTILLGNSEKYPLHAAIIEGDEAKIKAILRASPNAVFVRDPKGRTIFHLAAMYPVSEDVLDLFPNKVEQSFINGAESFLLKSAISLAFLTQNARMIWYCLCQQPAMHVVTLNSQMTVSKDRIISQVGRYDFHVMSYVYEHGLHETETGRSSLEGMIVVCDKVIQTLANEKAIDFYDPEYVGGREKETLLERLVRLDAVLLLKSFIKNTEGVQNLKIGMDTIFQKALDSSAFFVMEYLICECSLEVPASIKEGKLMKCIEAGKKNKDSAVYKMLVKEFCDEHRQARLSMENR